VCISRETERYGDGDKAERDDVAAASFEEADCAFVSSSGFLWAG